MMRLHRFIFASSRQKFFENYPDSTQAFDVRRNHKFFGMRSRSLKRSRHALQLKSASCVRSMKSTWGFSSSQLAKLGKATTSFREPQGSDNFHHPTAMCSIYGSPQIFESKDNQHLELEPYQQHEKQKAPSSACSDTLSRRDSDLTSDSRPDTEAGLEITFNIQLETPCHDGKSVRLRLGSSKRQLVIHEEKHRQSHQGVMDNSRTT